MMVKPVLISHCIGCQHYTEAMALLMKERVCPHSLWQARRMEAKSASCWTPPGCMDLVDEEPE